MAGTRRALHFVFKVADRTSTIKFYKDVLGMKVLRHEEFEEGCKASCNGPYDGRWSKTMVGYGPEDGHFVMELTYNYGIKSYQKGNDYQGITINSSSAFEKAGKLTSGTFKDDSNSEVVMEAPGGYPFRLVKEVLKGRASTSLPSPQLPFHFPLHPQLPLQFPLHLHSPLSLPCHSPIPLCSHFFPPPPPSSLPTPSTTHYPSPSTSLFPSNTFHSPLPFHLHSPLPFHLHSPFPFPSTLLFSSPSTPTSVPPPLPSSLPLPFPSSLLPPLSSSLLPPLSSFLPPPLSSSLPPPLPSSLPPPLSSSLQPPLPSSLPPPLPSSLPPPLPSSLPPPLSSSLPPPLPSSLPPPLPSSLPPPLPSSLPPPLPSSLPPPLPSSLPPPLSSSLPPPLPSSLPPPLSSSLPPPLPSSLPPPLPSSLPRPLPLPFHPQPLPLPSTLHLHFPADPVQKITLGVSEIQRSLDYWNKLLSMKIYGQTVNTVLLGYSDEQCKLELVQLEERVDHAEAFGRIAFSCPNSELVDIESSVKSAGHLILTPLVSLDTPGKATVQVVILADPDGHEICFVGDEGFRELSQVDPKADELLTKAMEEDKSTEWFEKKKNKAK